MSSLIMPLPSVGMFDAAQWQTVPIPYALFGRRTQCASAGGAWPKAAETVLGAVRARHAARRRADCRP
ncbi:hypothetical protein GR157_19860 [Burkholderia sp. 4701]|nr:hypothetical protein [Burkholderia sp. 4701]MXN83922.1 hypothetical protein [Burkholderia sp. 4812]